MCCGYERGYEEEVIEHFMNDQEFEDLVNYIVSATNIPRDHVVKVLLFERKFYLRNSVRE